MTSWFGLLIIGFCYVFACRTKNLIRWQCERFAKDNGGWITVFKNTWIWFENLKRQLDMKLDLLWIGVSQSRGSFVVVSFNHADLIVGLLSLLYFSSLIFDLHKRISLISLNIETCRNSLVLLSHNDAKSLGKCETNAMICKHIIHCFYYYR